DPGRLRSGPPTRSGRKLHAVRSQGRNRETLGEEPSIPWGEQGDLCGPANQGEPREARGLLAHAGLRQKLLDGFLFSEGFAKSPRQLDFPHRHGSRRLGRSDIPEFQINGCSSRGGTEGSGTECGTSEATAER